MTNFMPKCAFILAAGKGTRLRPYTDTMPKPMVPVAGKPILEHTLNKLQKEGINTVVINTNYLGDRIKNYTDHYQDLDIILSPETELLDTGGGVKKALVNLGDSPFFLINGDAFWVDEQQSALTRLAQNWNPGVMDILLLLQPVDHMVLTQGVGDYDLTPEGQAVRSLNKTGQYMFGGIRITKTGIIKEHTENVFSFLKLMDQAQAKQRLYGIIHQGDWHHISTPQDLEAVDASLGTQTKEAKSA